MAGTASTLTEYADPAELYPEQPKRLVDRLSDRLYGHNDTIYRNCTLFSISLHGGEILTPKDLVIAHTIFDLVIHVPDDSSKTSVITRVEMHWSDSNFSQSHRKIGFGFVNNTLSKELSIKRLLDRTKSSIAMDVDCSLIV